MTEKASEETTLERSNGCGSVYVLPNLDSLTILVPADESDAFEYSPNFDAWTEEFWI